MEDYLDGTTAVYVRAKAADRNDAEKAIEGVFGKVRYLSCENAPDHDIAFITGKAVERVLRQKLKSISMHIEPLSVMRICE